METRPGDAGPPQGRALALPEPEGDDGPTDAAWVVLVEGAIEGYDVAGDAWEGIRIGCAPPATYREKNGTLHLDAPGLAANTHVVYGVDVKVTDPGYAGPCGTGGVRYYAQEAPGRKEYQLTRGIAYALTFAAEYIVVLDDGTRIAPGGEGTLPVSLTRDVQDSEGGVHQVTYTGTLRVRNLGLMDKALLAAATAEEPAKPGAPGSLDEEADDTAAENETAADDAPGAPDEAPKAPEEAAPAEGAPKPAAPDEGGADEAPAPADGGEEAAAPDGAEEPEGDGTSHLVANLNP